MNNLKQLPPGDGGAKQVGEGGGRDFGRDISHRASSYDHEKTRV